MLPATGRITIVPPPLEILEYDVPCTKHPIPAPVISKPLLNANVEILIFEILNLENILHG